VASHPLLSARPQWTGFTLHQDRPGYSKEVSDHSFAMGQQRQYFVCKCGAWTWASKVQQGQTHCQCGKKWPTPAAPSRQQPRNPKPPKPSSPAPQRNAEQKDKREEERRLKRAVTTIWDQIPEEARSRLTQAGWRGPPRAKDSSETAADPLLNLLMQRKDELPEDVRAAVVEATSAPEPTAGERALQSNKDLSKASSRLRVLVTKKIKLLESIEEAKESLRLQLQELQDTTEKIHEAEAAVEKAKLELTKAVESPPPQGAAEKPEAPEPMDMEELVTALGITLTDEQQEKLDDLRARAKKRQRPPAVESPPGLPPSTASQFHLGTGAAPPAAPQGGNPLAAAKAATVGHPKGPDLGGRHRSRTPPKSGDPNATEEEQQKQGAE